MNTIDTTSSLAVEGRIETLVHDESKLREVSDDYDSLTNKEKMELAQEVEPEERDVVYNVTTQGMHKYFVRNLDGGLTDAADNVNADWFAVGTDGSTVATTDTDLSTTDDTKRFSKQVTDHADNIGSSPYELVASTFLASDEGNVGDIAEVGLFSGDPTDLAVDGGPEENFMLNHATLGSPVTKDNTKTLTFNVTLAFSDV